MKLAELLTVLNSYTVINVIDKRSIEVFQGEANIADGEINDRYLNATVCTIYTEYFKGFGKTGITIIVQP